MTPENHLVPATTLGLLDNHARREPGGGEVERRIEQLLREPALV
jgi:hypothetical protein